MCQLMKILALFMVIETSFAFVHSDERHTATPGQFPSVVSINVAQYGQHYCGGVIIGKKWVLTAARCMLTAIQGDYNLVVGSTHLSNGTKVNITEIKMHPKFDEKNLNDDLALLKTQTELTLGDNLQIAELGKVSVNSSGAVVGWDENRDDVEFINVKLLSSQECEKREDDANERRRSVGQVCAYGGPGVGICWGDWGSPLFVDGKLVALASYSVESCGLGFPDVYTDVSYYLDWIKKNT